MRWLPTIGKGLTHGLPPLLLLGLFYTPAFSQDSDDPMRDRIRLNQFSAVNESANSRMIREVRDAFVKDHMEASRAALEAGGSDAEAADRNFIARVPQFRTAVTNYRVALDLDAAPAKALKELDRFVNAFTRYFEQMHTDGPPADPSEFRDFSRKNLLWETLTSAERVDTKLRQAALLVREASASNVVTITSMLFLRNLHGELLRLDLLISKLK